ncbi:hypothetical protein H257_03270 [Aphanomyces astaci]|uniref:Uncharacterized protein n=1 Tax=Aphanomyces astaci TaxID=112090 RepID=W4H108_APHAT|nr:hypothetical protein H257_03270 [Aphanomyces astaci]ETV85562.1 hypothetical protein H257_03270 [Aphanomyces astaci]|eukprot:XP_009825580.1 hypothetical protein H257_03270 [Aphanomyces astaci]
MDPYDFPDWTEMHAFKDLFKAAQLHGALSSYLDLGFFPAIQALQYRKSAFYMNNLIANIKEEFVEYPIERIIHTFLSLQSYLVEVMSQQGDNTEMQRTVSLELKEARLMDELSRMPKCILLSDGSAESSADDIITVASFVLSENFYKL